MRDNMYENNWSPFNPRWYQAAFDQFISTADELFNRDLIIQQGFNLPDNDGSKSSVFRNEAVLNNSFNEKALRETLKDIYLNSTHKLIASNHDNTHFYQWNGYMSNMELIPNTNECQFKIPTNTFISSKERDKFKLSQYYRKWIKPEDILNNSKVFNWYCMLFIDQRIYSEYELRIDDHETTIRFKYYDYWVKVNHPVYIYKFDTNASCRILVSRELCENQWNWKVPISYIDNQKIVNSTNIIVAFNKISDQNIRTDGLTKIDVLGDNLEFLTIEDGYIDLNNISKFNKILIQSESTQWLWMTIVVPKFLHEYPILLPTDVVYRAYQPDLRPITTYDNMGIRNVKTDKNNIDKQVYIDMNGKLSGDYSTWKQMIRPIVLSDAYNDPFNEPYLSFIDELENLRDLTIKCADTIEDFRFFMKDYPTEDKFNEFIDKLINEVNDIHTAYNVFLKKRLIETDKAYEFQYKKFCDTINEIKEDGLYGEWFNDDPTSYDSEKDFWLFISPQVYIPREMYDKYSNVFILKSINDHGVLWNNIDHLLNKQRFRRPIDESGFWTFEYDIDSQVWRPYHLDINRHFPDVYLLTDPLEETPRTNRIFKTFFFYSDTMNVLNESADIVNPSTSWDKDMTEYYFDNGAVYRDIFMEKFYWMGIKAIYKEILVTNSRWEIIEYVIDNDSYDRFNQLFLNTMDPYFKMGLATYLKNPNYGFPFDYAIDKMNEGINSNLLGFKKVSNFEIYLNKTWIPSYFDYITKIMDDWMPGDRLLRRPRSSFDVMRLLPILLNLEYNISIAVGTVSDTLKWILSKLLNESYNLNIQNILDIQSKVEEMLQNIKDVYKFTNELDLDIYGIEDLNYIINGLNHHIQLISELEEIFSNSYKDINDHNVYMYKRELLKDIADNNIDKLYKLILSIGDMVQYFNMQNFMEAVNNLYTYLDYGKNNPDDNSLLGYINKFNDPWSTNVKELRNKLFQSSSNMYSSFNSSKSYTNEEVIEFTNIVEEVKSDIEKLSEMISRFWLIMGYEKDQVVIDKFDHVNSILNSFILNLNIYLDSRNSMIDEINKIINTLELMKKYDISMTEISYYNEIKNSLNGIISSLSYIVGENNKNEAINNFNIFKKYIAKWNEYINDEEEVFNKLLNFTKSPIEFIDRLHNDEALINKIIEYMDSTNIPYIPDTKWPNYIDVYSVDQVEIVNGGFHNNVDELLVVPHLGSYKIKQIEDEIGSVISIEDTGYRNTVFRDPMIQNNFYDTITNGNGMGVTIKPTHSKKSPIINDEIVRMYITRIQNSIYVISSNIDTPNPYNNPSCEDIINDINNIKQDWDNMISIYKNHISDRSYDYVNKLINMLIDLSGNTERLISVRKDIDLLTLITNIDKFINDAHQYAESISVIDNIYSEYESNIKTELYNIKDFYGNGSRWSDGSILKTLLDKIKYPIKLFKTKIVDNFEDEIEKNNIIELFNNIINLISIIEISLSGIPNIMVDINPIISKIKSDIRELPTDLIYQDKWYRIKNISVALEGDGYKVGDVLSIIPELPTDSMGNPIADMEEIIMNDTILVKIKEVIDGRVSVIEPLMDYAIPYLIWGIRKTRTLIGNGYGLTIDVYSYQVELSDSTIFDDKDTDISTLPQYNENDMFVFKFENTYDLNMQYEIFYGGKQITNFHQRHSSNADLLYLNANEVSSLKNSSIYTPAEHYFVYRLDNIKIKDPGAGYAVGQEIFVDLEMLALKLKVASLTPGPYKGIESVEMSDIRINEKFNNPSCDNAIVVDDSMNNIDDEFNVGYYDRLSKDCIIKGATRSLDPVEYPFISHRFDDLENGDRNKTFMYPDVDMPLVEGAAQNGDPDYGFYLGSRIGDNKWDGIENIIPPTDPFISDDKRTPANQPIKGEYQLIDQLRIHNSIDETNDDVTSVFESSVKNAAMVKGDYVVQSFSDLPRSITDWSNAKVGHRVIVECDETHNGHRMLYRLRTFVAAGYFVYDLPEIADYKWDHFEIDWMDCDYYPDYPSDKAKYSDAPWYDSKTFLGIQHSITDGKYTDKFPISEYNTTSYISNLTVDDISVWNCTTHEWEDLHDKTKWNLTVINDDENKKWGFILTYLEEGIYSYDMKLFLNKTPETQMKNASLKRNSVMDITTSIVDEVNNAAINKSVNTGRHLRIRKLFPYEQKETFTIGRNPDGSYTGYEMNFKIAPYMHFRNELHLEDVKIYNKNAGRFENILDPTLFEVRFKDERTIDSGYETRTKIIQSLISYSGEGFVNGEVWGYNKEFGISIFGEVTSNYKEGGNILTFTPIHCVNPPSEDISLEFNIYQRDTQTNQQMAIVIIEFNTERVKVEGDGYIHNVTNRLAPLPKEFKVICQYDLDTLCEYEIIISKTSRQWKFIEPKWIVSPTFHLPDYDIQQDRVYILTSNGRFPLVNPATGKPSINVVNKNDGTDVTFLNLYKRYEHIEVRTVPYPMRSVYVQRNIPKSGYINLAGKINKPLNKKYFEFWVNGKLLFDEVTIISPTKFFLHGLKSLKNLEIIEVNRDPNEYFSDTFLEVDQPYNSRPFYSWNYETYLDAALEGTLKGDNYTTEEQEYLLSPVWKQVEKDHPEFKNYPPNVDIEKDILVRVDDEDYPIEDLDEPIYQFMIVNIPTLEGIPLLDRSLSFEHFGFVPISDEEIIRIMNEEWEDEIESNPSFNEHVIMTDDEWYGMTTRLYDEYGIRVHNLNESVYKVTDPNLLRINTNSKLSRIVKNKVIYDLE